LVQPTHFETCKSARSDGLQHQHPRCSLGRVKPIAGFARREVTHRFERRRHLGDERPDHGVLNTLRNTHVTLGDSSTTLERALKAGARISGTHTAKQAP